MITRVLHFNINCTNFERSRAFYELLGFRPLHLGESIGAALENALGLPAGAHCVGGIFRLGTAEDGALLDLLEWQQPAPEGQPYDRLNNVGVARVCLISTDIWADHASLTEQGVEFVSEPQLLEGPDSAAWIVCFHDPDGTIIELAQFPDTAPWRD